MTDPRALGRRHADLVAANADAAALARHEAEVEAAAAGLVGARRQQFMDAYTRGLTQREGERRRVAAAMLLDADTGPLKVTRRTTMAQITARIEAVQAMIDAQAMADMHRDGLDEGPKELSDRLLELCREKVRLEAALKTRPQDASWREAVVLLSLMVLGFLAMVLFSPR